MEEDEAIVQIMINSEFYQAFDRMERWWNHGDNVMSMG
jgi:hypothetical protein